jgi:hypothetical protein
MKATIKNHQPQAGGIHWIILHTMKTLAAYTVLIVIAYLLYWIGAALTHVLNMATK